VLAIPATTASEKSLQYMEALFWQSNDDSSALASGPSSASSGEGLLALLSKHMVLLPRHTFRLRGCPPSFVAPDVEQA
jgi:hypothetical protein